MMPVATKLGRVVRDGSRTAATSKLEHFMIIVNGWKPLTIITKSFILDVAAVLDLSVVVTRNEEFTRSLYRVVLQGHMTN